MEVWDLYDENKNLTGKTMVRGEKVPDNYYHLVVHVWIKNSKGEYLISQRAENKTLPLKDLDKEKGKLVYTEARKMWKGRIFNDIMDVWLFEYNGEVDLKNATTDEVRDLKWMTKSEIKELYERGDLVQTLDYFFNEIDI